MASIRSLSLVLQRPRNADELHRLGLPSFVMQMRTSRSFLRLQVTMIASFGRSGLAARKACLISWFRINTGRESLARLSGVLMDLKPFTALRK